MRGKRKQFTNVTNGGAHTAWNEEPDWLAWRVRSLPAVIIRNNMYTLNGYVGVPEEHPMHGLHYDETDYMPVHGGLTYCGELPSHSYPDCPTFAGHWFFGFDTGHCMDFSPYMASLTSQFGSSPLFDGDDVVYRDLDYVIKEVTSLADQLANILAIHTHLSRGGPTGETQ